MDIGKARLMLGEEAKNMSDKEIQTLLDMLKSICSIVLEDYLKE